MMKMDAQRAKEENDMKRKYTSKQMLLDAIKHTRPRTRTTRSAVFHSKKEYSRQREKLSIKKDNW
jgi:hypothetical protein